MAMDSRRGGRKWLTLLLCLTDVGHLVRAELGKLSTATTAFARSRLPRSLLSAHFVAASGWFYGVTGLHEKWLSDLLLSNFAFWIVEVLGANQTLPPLRSPVRASRAHF
jgi:hypothetical protein